MQPCVLASLFVMATGSHYFVAGATGATGQRLVNQLLNDPSVTRVTAAVRDKAAAPLDYEAQTPSLKGVDVCITAIGTSRANAVVKESMEKMGNDEGFAHWLQKVDLGINVALAKQAHADGVQHFARISAINADSSKRGGGFEIYNRYQGESDDAVARYSFPTGLTIMRPGALDRGEEFRSKRPWEVERHINQGPGLSVDLLASKTIAAVKKALAAGESTVHIIMHKDIVGREEL
eukprot:GEMP01076259.1.p1 GENE.GEMP01076259.1~~GEMP01076259.1.p1  ORF type:complete len:235 (+),score=63.06 GEMP01076259.1:15-719(+)